SSHSHPLLQSSTPSFPTRRSSDLFLVEVELLPPHTAEYTSLRCRCSRFPDGRIRQIPVCASLIPHLHMLNSPLTQGDPVPCQRRDRKSTRLNSSHVSISYAVFCLI